MGLARKALPSALQFRYKRASSLDEGCTGVHPYTGGTGTGTGTTGAVHRTHLVQMNELAYIVKPLKARVGL